MNAEELSVLAWNLFHGRDGAPGARATRRSTWLGESVSDGIHLHRNRKLIAEMAELVARATPTVAALQEVPPAAVGEIVRATGMAAVSVRTGPLLGPVSLRSALGRWNPDLWKTHEGNANVLLVRRPWRIVPGSVRTSRHVPLRVVVRNVHRFGLSPHDARRWLTEGRRVVLARIASPAGATLTVACLHCHNAHDPAVVGVEVRGAVDLVERHVPPGEPVLLAGDLNARWSRDPILLELERRGYAEQALGAGPDRGLGVDHLLHRGLEVVDPVRRWLAAERELTVDGLLVRLSDHAPVEARYRLASPRPGAASSASRANTA